MPPHVQAVKAGGKVYYYLRLPGKKRVKLPNLPPTDPEFMRAYLELTADAPKASAPATGTIAAMFGALFKSDAFRSLSKTYQGTIRLHGAAIVEAGGTALARNLRQQHIKANLADLDAHPANSRLKTWRFACKWAMGAGLIDADPSEGIKRRKPPKTDGYPPWTIEEIEAYRAHWAYDTPQRLAFEVVYWSAARTIDAVRLGPGMIGRDGVLSYVQHKTKEPAYVPWSNTLPDFADPADHAHLMAALKHAPAQMTFLATQQGGRSRSVKGLSNLISDAAAAVLDENGKALIVGKSAHGLRKSRTISLVEHDATEAQGMSWTGHLTAEEFAYYAKARDRRRAVLRTDRKRVTVKNANPAVKSGAK